MKCCAMAREADVPHLTRGQGGSWTGTLGGLGTRASQHLKHFCVWVEITPLELLLGACPELCKRFMSSGTVRESWKGEMAGICCPILILVCFSPVIAPGTVKVVCVRDQNLQLHPSKMSILTSDGEIQFSFLPALFPSPCLHHRLTPWWSLMFELC